MYIPRHFNEDDGEKLTAFIREHAFGVLITTVEGRPFATHMPFIYEPESKRLLGHVARANPHWRHFSSGEDAMVLFQGPHAYVSPSWYVAPGVPTWNYATVHVYGSARALDDPSQVKRIVEGLTEIYERDNTPPWRPSYDERMLGAIVGIEIAVREVQGKFKLSQNRSAADRAAVISKLDGTGSENGSALAMLMKLDRPR